MSLPVGRTVTTANSPRAAAWWHGAALAVLVILGNAGCSTYQDSQQEAPEQTSHIPDHDVPSERVGATFALEDFGAVCDGRHDDRPALKAAAQAAAESGGGTVVVPRGTCRILATAADPSVELGSHVTLAGDGSRTSTLLLDTDDPTAYRELLRTSGDAITVTDLTMTSTAGVYGVFIQTIAGRGLTLTDVVINGPSRRNAGTTLHGLSLPAHGSLQDLRILGTTVRGVDYGLLQQSRSTATVTGITVADSTFADNHADDLAFNAPNGTMRDVLVQDSDFSGGGGFGISLANVQDVVLRQNQLSRKPKEFVHIEDRSSNVLVEGNTFSENIASTQEWYSFVFVVSGSNRIEITGNTFHTSPAEMRFQCVYVSPGGEDSPAPQEISVGDNEADLAENTTLLSVYGDSDVDRTP